MWKEDVWKQWTGQVTISEKKNDTFAVAYGD